LLTETAHPERSPE